jgi:hypothetical protein
MAVSPVVCTAEEEIDDEFDDDDDDSDYPVGKRWFVPAQTHITVSGTLNIDLQRVITDKSKSGKCLFFTSMYNKEPYVRAVNMYMHNIYIYHSCCVSIRLKFFTTMHNLLDFRVIQDLF